MLQSKSDLHYKLKSPSHSTACEYCVHFTPDKNNPEMGVCELMIKNQNRVHKDATCDKFEPMKGGN